MPSKQTKQQNTMSVTTTHGLKSQNRYWWLPMVFCIYIHQILAINIGNIDPNINQYHRVNIVSGASKPHTTICGIG